MRDDCAHEWSAYFEEYTETLHAVHDKECFVIDYKAVAKRAGNACVTLRESMQCEKEDGSYDVLSQADRNMWNEFFLDAEQRNISRLTDRFCQLLIEPLLMFLDERQAHIGFVDAYKIMRGLEAASLSSIPDSITSLLFNKLQFAK